MTSFALLPPALQRIFAWVDSAAATDASLQHLLEHWRRVRDGKVIPQLSDLQAEAWLTAETPHLFVFEACGPDWRLASAGIEALRFFGPMTDRAGLPELPNRRLAVRLRRLFRFVQEMGEPAAATFISTEPSGEPMLMEILATPLSSGGRYTDGILGAIAARQAGAAEAGRRLTAASATPTRWSRNRVGKPHARASRC